MLAIPLLMLLETILKNWYHYVINNNLKEMVSKLKNIIEKLFTWFSQNKIKANLRKCHMIFSTTISMYFQILETVIHNSQPKKLLGVTFHNNLKLEKQLNLIYQKVNTKLNTLAKITPYMELEKRQI